MGTFSHLQFAFYVITFLLIVRETEQAAISGKLIAEGYFVFDRKSLDIYMTEENNNIAQAKASLLEDFNFFLDDVNAFYSTMNHYGLNIDLWIADVQVLSEDIFQKSQLAADGSVDKDVSISTFGTFLRGNQALSSKLYDFAILMTGFDITGDTAGYARLATMCMQGNAYGVVEAWGVMGSVRTLAHEIGHLFGSNHDPEDAVTVMAPKLETNYNPQQFTFSSKSAQEIKTYLFGFSWRTSCLKTTLPSSKAPSVTPDSYRGRLQDVNVACKRFIDPRSHVCTSDHFYKGNLTGNNMCYMIACRDPENWKKCKYIIPTEGMACSHNKACKKGNCVVDVKANTRNVNSDCLWGDDPYVQGTLTGNCASAMLRQAGQACENENTRTGCCASCPRYKTNIAGCPYGDQALINMNNQDMSCDQLVDTFGAQTICERKDSNEFCCETCHGLRQGNPASCPYGDNEPLIVNSQQVTCAQAISMFGSSWTCKDSDYASSRCCKTCNNRGSECTDASSVILNYKSMTCPQAVQQAGPTTVCVTSNLKGQCCKTCTKLKQQNQGNTACPYGDLGVYSFQNSKTPTKCDSPFNKQYCQYDSFKSACCNFCSKP